MGIERYCESKIFSLLQIIMSTQVHPEHTSSPRFIVWVDDARSLVFCVVFCDSLFVFLYFFLWSLCCLSFSFGHCVVCLFPLVIVLSVFFLWSLCCMSFSFGHCVVCPSSFGHCVVCPSSFGQCCLSFDLRLLIIPLVSSNSSY
jgi:hypothetical protein